MGLRGLYVLVLGLITFIGFVGIEEWCFYNYSFLNDFGLDMTTLSLVDYSIDTGYSLIGTVDAILAVLLPTVYAEEHTLDLASMHPSFQTITQDTSPGGLLVQKLLIHIVQQEPLGLPIFLSHLGVTASHNLIGMLNDLPHNGISPFPGDNRIFEHLHNALGYKYTYNMLPSLTDISHIESYTLPVMNLRNGMDSGVYAFVHNESGNVGIGSAISFRGRLTDHMRSFNGTRETTFMHE